MTDDILHLMNEYTAYIQDWEHQSSEDLQYGVSLLNRAEALGYVLEWQSGSFDSNGDRTEEYTIARKVFF